METIKVKMMGNGLARVMERKKTDIIWAIDMDSIIHQRGHIVIKNNLNIEEGYQGILEKIYTLRGNVFKYLGVDRDRLIPLYAISPKKTFRNSLSINYKANRKPEPKVITQLKLMVAERFNDRLLMGDNIEADDFVTSISRLPSTIISAVDKDVYMSSTTVVQDYNIWDYNKQFQMKRTLEEIEVWYKYQSIIGDSVDGIKGARGVGKKKALELLNRTKSKPHFHQWASLFDDEEDAIMNMRLVRTDQFDINNLEVKLWNKNMWMD